MTRLQDDLRRACRELGLVIRAPFVLALPSGKQLAATALLPQLGAPKGMIVVSSYDVLRGSVEELGENGYGYSVLDEPLPGEEYEIDSFREMFLDWGWNASCEGRPDWME